MAKTPEKPPHGICPFMSQAVAYPKQPGSGEIVTGEVGIGTLTVSVACAGADCQLWDGCRNWCSIKGLHVSLDKIVVGLGYEGDPETMSPHNRRVKERATTATR